MAHSGIEKMVARIEDPDGPFYTIKQVAEKLGVSRDTVRRWGSPLGIPNHKMPLGEGNNPNSYCWLWTEGDIHTLAQCKQK